MKKAKVTPKKKAPVQLTAGTGFRNENCIAARFLLDLLAGTNTLGEEFGKIDRVQWQGRDLGWLSDDLVIECSASAGKRAAGISIKSDRQVTGAGPDRENNCIVAPAKDALGLDAQPLHPCGGDEIRGKAERSRFSQSRR